ncbi:MAG: heme-binding domain-containing protein [Ignavibacteria bacterium]|nr:heme-binding domain-containing protein [Ignavibacteria bacterium]
MKILRITGFTLLACLVVAQFVQPDLNRSSAEPTAAIENRFPIPDDVLRILDRSCYDCHSDNTIYPWYAHIQPVGWWLADHVDEGKGHLNFDQFLTYSTVRQYHKLEEIREMVELDEMPLPSYLILHSDAVLTAESSGRLLAWSDAMRDSMASWYPPDSLRRPQR